jgi:orotidine-5'-phosphate decarboxylase
MKDNIITALDFDRYDEAVGLVGQLPEAVFFKVGLQAFLKFGEPLIGHLQEQHKKLFLDLKFKDIPNTVYGAVRSALRYSPHFLTIHLSGGAEMIRRAVEAAAGKPGLTILGVTVLTSLSDTDLAETGSSLSTADAVLRLCELGVRSGIRAVVCSPLEIEPIRKRFGRDLLLVTPGIRPAWSAKGDQKRIFTPRRAIAAGADYLVIGRPISRHQDPAKAFSLILEEITPPYPNP